MKLSRQTDNQKGNIMPTFIRSRKERQSHQQYDVDNQDRLTLHYLMQLDSKCDVVVNCNQTINISIIDNQAQANRKSFHYPDNKKMVKTQIFVGSGLTRILGQCFQSYNNGNNHDYVFTCFEKQSDECLEQMDQRQMKNSQKHLKKPVQQINVMSNTNTNKSKRKEMQLRMDQQSNFEMNMKKKQFILSEQCQKTQQLKYVKPNKLSQKNKTSKQNLQRQIRNNLRNITNTYLRKMQGSASEIQIYVNNFQKDERLSYQHQNFNKISNGQRKIDQIEMDSPPKKSNQGTIGQYQQERHLNLSFAKCQEFPQILPKILESSISEYHLEINQANLEQEVKKQVNIACKNDASEVSELNSHIDIHLQSQNQIQSDKPVNDSFLRQQDKIKVQLNDLAAQRERQVNNFVQITQKVIDPNHSEYFVKYNCRILQKRTPQTDVMRVSPFKRRKIEVRQIHSAKNIEKLSEIIPKN